MFPATTGFVDVHKNRLAAVSAIFVAKESGDLHVRKAAPLIVRHNKLKVVAIIDAHEILADVSAMSPYFGKRRLQLETLSEAEPVSDFSHHHVGLFFWNTRYDDHAVLAKAAQDFINRSMRAVELKSPQA